MATLPTHALVGAALVYLIGPEKKKRTLALTAALLALLPDADVISFNLGIPYAAEWGHRGASHSVLFSALIALPLALWLFRAENTKYKVLAWGVLALAGISHGLLDGLTNGGLGIAYAWPWDQSRYFLPWRPIQVSPIGGAAFTSRIIKVLSNEFFWVWLPCLALLTVNHQIKGKR